MPSPVFEPAEAILDGLLDDLSSPNLSLTDIALNCGTTIEALSVWLGTDGATLLIQHSLHAATLRTRLAATHALPTAVQALVTALTDYSKEDYNAGRESSADTPCIREHRRTSARRAAQLLTRLANFIPRSTEPVFSRTPSVSAGPRSHPHATGAGSSSPPAFASLAVPTASALHHTHPTVQPQQPPSTPTIPLRASGGGGRVFEAEGGASDHPVNTDAVPSRPPPASSNGHAHPTATAAKASAPTNQVSSVTLSSSSPRSRLESPPQPLSSGPHPRSPPK